MYDVWFTADLHLGHSRVIEFSQRPFRDIDEMDETLLSNINEPVHKNDEFYVLGDFAFRSYKYYVDRIVCKNIHLLLGNHCLKNIRAADYRLFRSVDHLSEIRVRKQKIVLCHYAMETWNRQHYGSWMLHGHSHHTLPVREDILRMDVGVDGEGYNYSPLNFEYIRDVMSKRQNWVVTDGHETEPQGGYRKGNEPTGDI